MRVNLQALQLSVTPEEMQAKVPREIQGSLKGKGVLQAYRVAHEGVSRPRVLGTGTKSLQWGRAVIHRLADKIKSGTKFFKGHGATNSHDGRRSVGEVVASYTKEIGGRLSDVVIGHFPEPSEVAPMDVCSIEADVRITDDRVDDVNDVTGVALGASGSDSPAFAGAGRLAVLQCFEEPGELDFEGSKSKGEKEVLNFSAVKEFVRERNVFPHQLYTKDDLKNDREFAPLLSRSDDLEKVNKELSEANRKLSEEKSKLVKEAGIGAAKDRFSGMLPNDLTEKQKSFMMGRFDAEAVSDMDDASLKTYIESERKQFAEMAKLFGVAGSPPSGYVPEPSGAEAEGDSTPEEEALKLMGVV